MESKKSLREAFFFQRSLLSAEKTKQWSNTIFQNLLQFEPLLNRKIIFTYLSFDNEVDTLQLAKWLLTNDKQLTIPFVFKGVIIPTEIKSFDKNLHPGKFGILEPAQNQLRPLPVESVEIFIVPGIVFDQHGYRLGFGYGYFDKLLSQASSHALKIGLAFDFQILPQLPTEPWDVKMDLIFTEQRVITCQQQS